MVLHGRDLVEIKIIRVSLVDAMCFSFNSLMLFNAREFVSVYTYCRISTYSLHKISKCEICIYFSAAVLFGSSCRVQTTILLSYCISSI